VCVVLLAALTAVSYADGQWQRGNQTDWIRLTEDGRSVNGSFSPDGSMVALVSLRKQFTSEGLTYFERYLRVWQDGDVRDVARLQNTEAFGGCYYRNVAAETDVEWLPSGKLILVGLQPGWTLVRLSDGATTRTDAKGDWFVLNDDWGLSTEDAGRLNRLVHAAPPSYGWLPIGEPITHDGLPPQVPRGSDNWSHYDFQRSPGDADLAAYLGWAECSGYCSCEKELIPRYIGVVDLRTGATRRLTWGTNHTVSWTCISWSPTGSHIVYVRNEYDESRTDMTTSDLHAIRVDGTRDTHLASNVDDFTWFSTTQMVLEVQPYGSRDAASARTRQLVVADVRTGRTHQITSGHFCHTFADACGGRYLVAEQGLRSPCSGDLYIIRPL